MDNNNPAVLAELQRMNRLLALVAVGGKKQVDQIQILSNTGFQPKEIAQLLGTTSNTVNVALSGLRKAGKKKNDGHRKE